MVRDNPKYTGRREEARYKNGLISFSFRYFQDSDKFPAQSLKSWESDNALLDMLNALIHMSKENITQLQVTKRITLYGEFPESSVNEFSLPTNLDKNENWGTLRNIGGQKARIVGFLRENIFYIVYLDKEHKFYHSK